MATNQRPNLPRPAELLSALLDKGYTEATAQVIRSIARDIETGILATRLKQFDDRARELADAGQSMSADDPTLRALLADFGDVLRKDAILIDAAAPDVQAIGIDAAGQFVRRTALPGYSDPMLNSIGVRWNYVDPEAVMKAVEFTGTDAWRAQLEQYQQGISEQVRAIAIRGIVSGQGPLTIAADVRAAVANIPAYRANSIMRTTQLESYRAAVAENQLANSDILMEQIRIAALDDRTCLACIALHGTIMPIGEVVEDHENGRCTSVTRLKGELGDLIFQQFVGSDPVTFKTGEEWFSVLPKARQREIAGDAAYNALKANEVILQDFVQHHTSEVFGSMIHQASLADILGDRAPDFYQRNQDKAEE